jgi:acetyl/propionyl-CoA carboxylase alpha subunit
MFHKVLVANRGEIAVRILRTCREMGLHTVALYEPPDRGSLHVRLADEAIRLPSPGGFRDGAAIVHLAHAHGADAIHPGYGFLAEEPAFIRACAAAGLAFIGPPADVVQRLRDKPAALARAAAHGFPTLPHSACGFGPQDTQAALAAAERLGFPLVVKSCRGGRGRGERLVPAPASLPAALRWAQSEALTVYDDQSMYFEQAVIPAHQIGVQVLGDRHGRLIHLGEREGSLIAGNQKILEETPAPSLTPELRQRLCDMALALARLFECQNAVTVEFLVDSTGQVYFTEIKARLQMEHPLPEMVSRLDLVREQIRLAAGEPLSLEQSAVTLSGCAMQCRVSAEDPSQGFRPAPGILQRLRLPAGPGVRVDTFAYSGCAIPDAYDPLIAKLIVWGHDRPACAERLARALEEFSLVGTPSNLPLLQQLVDDPGFRRGCYDTETLSHLQPPPPPAGPYLRDLAVIAAILHELRGQAHQPSLPERLASGWHRSARRLAH